jgi:hypothetical protein
VCVFSLHVRKDEEFEVEVESARHSNHIKDTEGCDLESFGILHTAGVG